MISARIDVREASQRLSRMAAKLDDLETPNRALAIKLYQEVMYTFDREASDGMPWAPLKPATVKWKAKRGYRQVLRNSGALRASFLQFADRRYAGVGALSNREHADIAAVHQDGSKDGHVPARPMLPTEQYAARTALQVYQFYIERLKQER